MAEQEMPSAVTQTDSMSVKLVDSMEPVPGGSASSTESTSLKPTSVTPAPEVGTESRTLSAQSVVRPPKSFPTPDAELSHLVNSAKPPCTIVLRDAADVETVQRLVMGSKKTYAIKVRENLSVRGIWRQL